MKTKLESWLALFIITLAALLFVAVPVFLIKPFSPQSPSDLTISFWLKSWSPFATIVLAILSVAVVVYLWRNSRYWLSKAVLILPLFITMICIWFARQNHFEWMFNPLANSSYARTNNVNFVEENDMVLAVELNGESTAYPVRQMAYHHIVEDIVGGVPIAATY